MKYELCQLCDNFKPCDRITALKKQYYIEYPNKSYDIAIISHRQQITRGGNQKKGEIYFLLNNMGNKQSMLVMLWLFPREVKRFSHTFLTEKMV